MSSKQDIAEALTSDFFKGAIKEDMLSYVSSPDYGTVTVNNPGVYTVYLSSGTKVSESSRGGMKAYFSYDSED